MADVLLPAVLACRRPRARLLSCSILVPLLRVRPATPGARVCGAFGVVASTRLPLVVVVQTRDSAVCRVMQGGGVCSVPGTSTMPAFHGNSHMRCRQ
jgi:hypothetical protein